MFSELIEHHAIRILYHSISSAMPACVPAVYSAQGDKVLDAHSNQEAEKRDTALRAEGLARH